MSTVEHSLIVAITSLNFQPLQVYNKSHLEYCTTKQPCVILAKISRDAIDHKTIEIFYLPVREELNSV